MWHEVTRTQMVMGEPKRVRRQYTSKSSPPSYGRGYTTCKCAKESNEKCSKGYDKLLPRCCMYMKNKVLLPYLYGNSYVRFTVTLPYHLLLPVPDTIWYHIQYGYSSSINSKGF